MVLLGKGDQVRAGIVCDALTVHASEPDVELRREDQRRDVSGMDIGARARIVPGRGRKGLQGPTDELAMSIRLRTEINSN